MSDYTAEQQAGINEFGLSAILDKNGKPMKGLPLTTRLAKLRKEGAQKPPISKPATVEPAPVQAAPAPVAVEPAPALVGSKENPLPTIEPAAAPKTVSASQFTAKKTAFEVESEIVPLPERKRAGGPGKPRGSMYPFATLEIGQSFFVPVTEADKQPWRNMGAMSSAKGAELYPKAFRSSHMLKKPNEAPNAISNPDGVRIHRLPDQTEPRVKRTRTPKA